MNNFLQMLMRQAPQKIMGPLEQQLKRVNPQAYQQFQNARKNIEDPRQFLNKITNGFNQQQKEQWNNMMNDVYKNQNEIKKD